MQVPPTTDALLRRPGMRKAVALIRPTSRRPVADSPVPTARHWLQASVQIGYGDGAPDSAPKGPQSRASGWEPATDRRVRGACRVSPTGTLVRVENSG